MPNNNLTLPSQQPPKKQSTDRLQQLSEQMGSTNGTSASAFGKDIVPQAPEDPMFGLMAAYRRDTAEMKIDLGIGAYRDNNGKPWILPVVKQVSITFHPYHMPSELIYMFF